MMMIRHAVGCRRPNDPSAPDRRGRIVTLIACIFGLVSIALAQQPSPAATCDNGLIVLQGNVSGRLTLCSSLAAQTPALVRQLAAVDQGVQGQQRQVEALTRLIRGVNSVGLNMERSRQSDLLRNLLAQLEVNQRAGASQAEQLMAVLSDGFERLQNQMLAGLTNRAAAPRVQAALEGSVGDAIARLDLAGAEQQLSQILAQLQKIGDQVAEVNQRAAGIQSALDDRQLDLPQVGSAIASADSRRLRALMAAGLQPKVLEEAFRLTDAKGQTNARRFFESSVEAEDAAQWFDEALAGGLDPNLTVPSATFGREAILSVAMQAGNVGAMRALLRRGASPHPYQAIGATVPLKPRFLFPLDYLANDARLPLADKVSLAKLFLEAGAVVPTMPPKDRRSYAGGEAGHEMSQVGETVRTKLGATVAPLPPWGNLNQICRQAAPRTGEDWCAIIAAIPRKLTFKSSAQSWNWYDIELRYPIHISRTRLYFLATSGDYTLAEVSRDGAAWTLYRYGGDSAGEGGCRTTGSSRTDFCWKSFKLHAVRGTNEMRSEGREAVWTIDESAAPAKP